MWRTSYHGFDELDAAALKREFEPLRRADERLSAMAAALAKKKVEIARPPGRSLAKLARLFVGPKVCARIVEPIIADMRHEYFEALAQGDRLAARAAIARGWFALLRAAWSGILGLLRP